MRFQNSRNKMAVLDLTVKLNSLLFVVLGIQQVSHVAKLLGCRLECFDLFSQLRLLGLLFAENLVDISHGTCLLSRNLRVDSYAVNEGCPALGYVRNELGSGMLLS